MKQIEDKNHPLYGCEKIIEIIQEYSDVLERTKRLQARMSQALHIPVINRFYEMFDEEVKFFIKINVLQHDLPENYFKKDLLYHLVTESLVITKNNIEVINWEGRLSKEDLIAKGVNYPIEENLEKMFEKIQNQSKGFISLNVMPDQSGKNFVVIVGKILVPQAIEA